MLQYVFRATAVARPAGNPGMPVSAKTQQFPLKIGTKREEKEGKSWKILQFSDVWPAKFSTKFDGDVLQTFSRPRAHLFRYSST
jgi:hypothetical protein